MATTNYYDILNVEQSATLEEIKKSYHILAKEHHPDKSKNDGDEFVVISEAFEVLSDSQKREEYDTTLKNIKINEEKQSVAFEVSLNQCQYICCENNIKYYDYECRCGDYFLIEIAQNNFKSGSCMFTCPTCCLNLGVKI